MRATKDITVTNNLHTDASHSQDLQIEIATGIHLDVLTPDGQNVKGKDGQVLFPLSSIPTGKHLNGILGIPEFIEITSDGISIPTGTSQRPNCPLKGMVSQKSMCSPLRVPLAVPENVPLADGMLAVRELQRFLTERGCEGSRRLHAGTPPCSYLKRLVSEADRYLGRLEARTKRTGSGSAPDKQEQRSSRNLKGTAGRRMGLKSE